MDIIIEFHYQNLTPMFWIRFFTIGPYFGRVLISAFQFRLQTDIHNVCLSAVKSKNTSNLRTYFHKLSRGHFSEFKNTKFYTYFCEYKPYIQIYSVYCAIGTKCVMNFSGIDAVIYCLCAAPFTRVALITSI